MNILDKLNKRQALKTIFLVLTVGGIVFSVFWYKYKADVISFSQSKSESFTSFSKPAVFTGKVINVNNEPLSEVQIIVGPFITISYQDGFFWLNGITPGYYPITFVKDGRQLVSQKERMGGGLYISDEASTPYTFVLAPLTEIQTAISAPTANTLVLGAAAVEVSATSSQTDLAKVELLVDDQVAATQESAPYTFSLDTTKFSDGEHKLKSKAYDAYGSNRTSAEVTVKINNHLPEVAITGPKTGDFVWDDPASHGTWVEVTATDNEAVTKVELYADGQLYREAKTSPPYTFLWQTGLDPNLTGTPPFSDGEHKLKAKAYDVLGDKESAEITVKVNNLRPQVAVIAPANNNYVSQTATVTVAATDLFGISKVELYLDGKLLETRETPLFGFLWDTTKVTDGDHQLKAKAFDLGGRSQESVAVTLKVDNTTPTTALTKPTNNAFVKGTAIFEATASDSSGITKVELFIDGQLAGTKETAPYVFEVDTRPLTNGSHRAYSRATDKAGVTANSAEVSFSVDNIAPQISIIKPADLTQLSGIATVETAPADNFNLAKVELKVDAKLVATQTAVPYNFSFDTKAFSSRNDPYQLLVIAYDQAGNQGSASIKVKIDNSPPSVGFSNPYDGAAIRGSTATELAAWSQDYESQIESVEFFYSIGEHKDISLGKATQTTAPYKITWRSGLPYGDGWYDLAVVAKNKAGLTAKTAIRVLVTGALDPTVTLTAPLEGAETNPNTTVTLTASALGSPIIGTNNTYTGLNYGITKVEFYDGINTVPVCTATAPTTDNSKLVGSIPSIYNCQWTVPDYGFYPMFYLLSAKAYDASGKVSYSDPVATHTGSWWSTANYYLYTWYWDFLDLMGGLF